MGRRSRSLKSGGWHMKHGAGSDMGAPLIELIAVSTGWTASGSACRRPRPHCPFSYPGLIAYWSKAVSVVFCIFSAPEVLSVPELQLEQSCAQ